MGKRKVYIANDVEAAGGLLGVHPTLSLGACVVTREPLTYKEYADKGLVFYAELKPTSLAFNLAAMRVGCLHLACLEGLRETDSRYDPTHDDFNPGLVLELMQKVCEEPASALHRFSEWVEKVSEGNPVEGVTDTVFFDSGRINLCFGVHMERISPFGWAGLDLSSLYRGYVKKPDVKLKGLNLPDTREKPHRADHDAVLLAQLARVLLYEKLGW
ncbi:MAG: hypothetical protein HY457_01040 [Parcubacteria group bacterium]|nr:hypothetical protein [Parcubacteria group bacterium]